MLEPDLPPNAKGAHREAQTSASAPDAYWRLVKHGRDVHRLLLQFIKQVIQAGRLPVQQQLEPARGELVFDDFPFLGIKKERALEASNLTLCSTHFHDYPRQEVTPPSIQEPND